MGYFIISEEEKKINHSKETFLNNYINKFRDALGDKTLDVSTLHGLLINNGVIKNENGTYNKSDLNILLQKPNCPRMQRIRNSYINYKNDKPIINIPISQRLTFDTNKTVEKPSSPTPKQQNVDDEAYYKDGRTMEDVHELLLKKYMEETTQKTVNLSKSDIYGIITEAVNIVLNKDKYTKETQIGKNKLPYETF